MSTSIRGLRSPSKSIDCNVVSEPVVGTLRRRHFGEAPALFVQCSERDCQYYDVNEPPCPLTVDLFAAELRELSARRARDADQ